MLRSELSRRNQGDYGTILEASWVTGACWTKFLFDDCRGHRFVAEDFDKEYERALRYITKLMCITAKRISLRGVVGVFPDLMFSEEDGMTYIEVGLGMNARRKEAASGFTRRVTNVLLEGNRLLLECTDVLMVFTYTYDLEDAYARFRAKWEGTDIDDVEDKLSFDIREELCNEGRGQTDGSVQAPEGHPQIDTQTDRVPP